MSDFGREIDLTTVLGVKVICSENTPADLINEPITVEMVLRPGAESFLHIHPRQDERYEVLTGTLDLYLNGQWIQFGPGKAATIPKGSVHAYRNSSGEIVRARNTHAPGLRFQEYLLVMEELVRQGKVTHTKGLRNSLYLSLHAIRFEREVIPVRPSPRIIRIGAVLARILRLKL